MRRLAAAAMVAGLVGLVLWTAPRAESSLPSLNGPALAEVQNYLFLIQDGSKNLTVLDTSKDSLAGSLELGLVPSHIAVSKSTRRLAAIDGGSARVELLDLAKGGGQDLSLPFTPVQLTVSPDGKKLAVGGGGSVVLIDLEQIRIQAKADGLGVLKDLMFSADGASLFAASGTEIAVLDTANALQRRDAALAAKGFTRAPDGRAVFARSGDGISVLDAKSLKPVIKLPGDDGTTAQPTATGDYLLLLDSPRQTLTLVHGDRWETGKSFHIPADAVTAYSGWFDSVAVIPSHDAHSLTVIDLWRQYQGKDIALPAAPLAGAVSGDGAKLYLPLEGKAKLAVVDLRNRKLDQIITLPQPARLAVLADCYGICH